MNSYSIGNLNSKSRFTLPIMREIFTQISSHLLSHKLEAITLEMYVQSFSWQITSFKQPLKSIGTNESIRETPD